MVIGNTVTWIRSVGKLKCVYMSISRYRLFKQPSNNYVSPFIYYLDHAPSCVPSHNAESLRIVSTFFSFSSPSFISPLRSRTILQSERECILCPRLQRNSRAGIVAGIWNHPLEWHLDGVASRSRTALVESRASAWWSPSLSSFGQSTTQKKGLKALLRLIIRHLITLSKAVEWF